MFEDTPEADNRNLREYIDTLTARIAQLEKALGVAITALDEYKRAGEWKVKKVPKNFCTMDCESNCHMHTYEMNQKFKTILGSDIAVEALTTIKSIMESEAEGG